MSGHIQIYASGDHYHPIGDALPDLKELTQKVTGKSYRRVGRFIQLALIGAARCTSLAVPKDTAVYLASGRGDLELTVDIMEELFARAQTPKPLSFVNTVSNAACFYVAQLLNLQSRSNYICNRYFPIESAMQLALTDVHLGNVDSALVGSIDVATNPLVEHRIRLQVSPDTAVGEGSHWLWLGKVDADRPRLGELHEVLHFANLNLLFAWSDTHRIGNLALSRGQYIGDDDWQVIEAKISHRALFDYRSQRAYYDSHSGAVIGEFLRSECNADAMLHLNSDDDGRYSAMLVRR